MTILFWNIHKADAVLPHLACLAARHAVDVFLLAECPKDIGPGIRALGPAFREADNGGCKVRALTRLEPSAFVHVYAGMGGDLAAWLLPAPKLRSKVLLGGIHLPSKAGGMTETAQAVVAGEVVADLLGWEDSEGHRNTALVGDFNMQPYDEGMTSVTGFHAVVTRRLAEMPDRVYRKQPRRRFYNPMWGLFGDRTPGPAGTYRWDSSATHNTHWAMLDQVLVRPSLIPCLAELGILDHDGGHPLVGGDGFPDAEGFSDHLPVIFRLDV